MSWPLARNADAVTPSDSKVLPAASTAGLLVGTGGTLTVTMVTGQIVQMTVVAGFVPIIVTQVWSTGTAASAITSLRA